MIERRSIPGFLATLGLLCGAASPAFGQGETGFLRGEGRLDVSITYNRDYYDEFWVGENKVSGAAAGTGDITREAVNVWGAYGVREDLDIFATGSLVEAESDGAGAGTAFPETEKDLQDFVLGAKWRCWEAQAARGAFSVLLSPAIKVPMGDYADDQPTAIGDGQVDLRGRVILHYQHESGAFASFETGYDRRNGFPDDELVYNLTVGATFGQLTLAPFYTVTDSRGGNDISDLPAPGGFPGLQEDVTRAGLSAYYRVDDRVGLTAGWRTTIDGRNTGDSDGLTVGVVFTL